MLMCENYGENYGRKMMHGVIYPSFIQRDKTVININR